MAREIKNVEMKGKYVGIYEVKGKDGRMYLYAQVLQNEKGRASLVDIRIQDLDVVSSYKDFEDVSIKVDIREMLTKEGRPFIVIDAAA